MAGWGRVAGRGDGSWTGGDVFFRRLKCIYEPANVIKTFKRKFESFLKKIYFLSNICPYRPTDAWPKR